MSSGKNDNILFTTRRNDPDNYHLNTRPITIAGTNIPSYMGGRANPWPQADGNLVIKNPYQKSAPKDYNSFAKLSKQLGHGGNDASDGKMDFVVFHNAFSQAICKRGSRLLQDEGPIEFKFKERVRFFNIKAL